MKDNLLDIPRTIKLGRYLMKIVRQDLWLWGITNAVGLILALCGIFHPSTAAAYNFLTDFLPLLNSLKLFKLHLNKKI